MITPASLCWQRGVVANPFSVPVLVETGQDAISSQPNARFLQTKKIWKPQGTADAVQTDLAGGLTLDLA